MPDAIAPKMSYTKLFQKILDSTIWLEDDQTRIVWITMLAMSDGEGFVLASVPSLARRANVPLESCQTALEKFLAPELHSSSQEFQGRRIEPIDGGWKLLNHAKYKSMMSLEHRRAYNAIKQKQYRDRNKAIDKERTIKEQIRDKSKAADFIDRHSKPEMHHPPGWDREIPNPGLPKREV